MNDTVTLKNIHSARGEVYTFLSRVFANVPDDTFYEIVYQIAPKLQEISLGTDNADLSNGTAGIIAFIEKRKGLVGKELSDFDLNTARHYTTMFCLAKAIPMDESVYTSEDHREKMDSYDKMKKLFTKYGMTKTKKLSENEDFISYELTFMARLAYESGEFAEKKDNDKYKKYVKEQYDFHINHFDKWINLLFSNVVMFDIKDEELYKNIATFARGFVAEDKAALKELIGE